MKRLQLFFCILMESSRVSMSLGISLTNPFNFFDLCIAGNLNLLHMTKKDCVSGLVASQETIIGIII